MHLKYLYIYSKHLNRDKFLRTMSLSMILNVHVILCLFSTVFFLVQTKLVN